MFFSLHFSFALQTRINVPSDSALPSLSLRSPNFSRLMSLKKTNTYCSIKCPSSELRALDISGLRPCLYGLGYPRQPPPSYPGEANFSLLSLKNSTNCLHENANSSRGWGEGARQLGWASHLGR